MKRTKAQNIAEDLRHSICSGTYGSKGSRLPSVRSLAKTYGAGVNSVVAALKLLQSDGLVMALPRSGYRIIYQPQRIEKDPQAPADIADVIMRAWRNRGVPGMVLLSNCIFPPELSPLARLQQTAMHAVEHNFSAACKYDGLPGRAELRQAIARRLRALGAQVDADEILITNGALEAIRLALQSSCRRGAAVAVESPGYSAWWHTLSDLGLRPVAINISAAGGIDVEAVEKSIHTENICAVLCSPVFANPHGGCLANTKRQQLLKLCHQHNIAIIEDDANGEMSHAAQRPPPLLAEDEHGLVLHAGSLTKSLGAGLQLGFLIARNLMPQACRHKVACNLTTSVIPQLMAAAILSHSKIEATLSDAGAELGRRMARCRQAIVDHFPRSCTVSKPQGGAALWIQMPRKINGERLYSDGVRCGLRANPGTLYGPGHEHALRIAGSVWNDDIQTAIEHLGRLASHQLRS